MKPRILAYSEESWWPVIVLNFKISNPLPFAIKDVPLECDFAAPSGTVLATRGRIVYLVVPARGEIWANNVSFGLAPEGLERNDYYGSHTRNEGRCIAGHGTIVTD